MSPNQNHASRQDQALAEKGIEVRGPITPNYSEILTNDALEFVASLSRGFERRRQQLLAARRQRSLNSPSS